MNSSFFLSCIYDRLKTYTNIEVALCNLNSILNKSIKIFSYYVFIIFFLVIHHTNLVEDIAKVASNNEDKMHIKNCAEEVLGQITLGKFEVPFEDKRINVRFSIKQN